MWKRRRARRSALQIVHSGMPRSTRASISVAFRPPKCDHPPRARASPHAYWAWAINIIGRRVATSRFAVRRVAKMCSGGGRQILVGLVLLAAGASPSSLAVETGDGDAELLGGGSLNISGIRGAEKKAEEFYDGGGYGNGYADYGGGYGHHGGAGLVRTQGNTMISACSWTTYC